MSLPKRFLMGMLSGSVGVVVKIGLNVLLIPVLIRAIGFETYSLYVLLFGLYELTQLLGFGFNTASIKLLTEARSTGNPELARTYIASARWYYWGLMSLTFLAGFMLLPVYLQIFHIKAVLQPVFQLGYWIFLGEALMALYGLFYQALLQSQSFHQWVNVSDMLYHYLSITVGMGLLLAGYGLEGFLWCRFVSMTLKVAFLIFQTRRVETDGFFSGVSGHFHTLLTMLKLSAHAFMVNLSIQISHKIDTFVIAAFLPLSAVGLYEIVFRFMSVVSQVCEKVCEGVLPLYTRLVSQAETQQTQRVFLGMSSLLNCLAGVLLLLITAFYSDLFTWIANRQVDVAETYPLLAVALPLAWSGALQMPTGPYLFASGSQRYFTVSSVSAALANLVLSLLLVKPFGIIGVALGTLIPQLIQHHLSLIRTTCRNLGIGFKLYFKSVYLTVLPAWFVSMAWIGFMTLQQTEGIFTLLWMVLTGCSALALSGWVWLSLFFSAEEKKIFRGWFLKPKVVQP